MGEHVELQFTLVLVILNISAKKTSVLRGLLLCLLFPLPPFLLGGVFETFHSETAFDLR